MKKKLLASAVMAGLLVSPTSQAAFWDDIADFFKEDVKNFFEEDVKNFFEDDFVGGIKDGLVILKGIGTLVSNGATGLSNSFKDIDIASSAVSDYENNSWVAKASDLQRQLDLYSPLKDNNILGTHNTYNSSVYSTATSYLDPQQKYSIFDQLRMGARFIELDAHWSYATHGTDWGNKLLLCHSGIGKNLGDLDLGCSPTDRVYEAGLQEIQAWLSHPRNRSEVIILYIEDHIDGQNQKLYDLIQRTIGNKVYHSGGCNKPENLTKAQILNAGKQVVVWKDNGCSGHNGIKNMVFTSLGEIGRVWEDGTTIGAIGGHFNGGLDYVTVEDIRNGFPQGNNIIALDNMVLNDGRLDAAIWSWNTNEPNNSNNEDCAEQYDHGRWNDNQCSNVQHHACRNSETGDWAISGWPGSWDTGESACQSLGGDWHFDTPENAQQNKTLKALHSGTRVWLNYHDRNVEGKWEVVGRARVNTQDWRMLISSRNGRCLDVEGGENRNGANVQLYSCHGNDNQLWRYEPETGFLKNKMGRCLDNSGGEYGNGGNLQIWDCVSGHNNQRFEWVGNSLRLRHQMGQAVDNYGHDNKANAGLWNYHGGDNQQWYWGN